MGLRNSRTVVEALYNDEDWMTQDGRVIPYPDLEESHARNILGFMERNAERYQYVTLMDFLRHPEPTSDGAWNAYQLELQRLEDAEPVEFERSTPAYKAVERRLNEH